MTLLNLIILCISLIKFTQGQACTGNGDCKTWAQGFCRSGTCGGCNSGSECVNRFGSYTDCNGGRCILSCTGWPGPGEGNCKNAMSLCNNSGVLKNCVDCLGIVSSGQSCGRSYSSDYKCYSYQGYGVCAKCAAHIQCTSKALANCNDFQCKACDNDDQCLHFGSDNFCNSGECVECLVNNSNECQSPEKSVCLNKQCIPCTYPNHSQCSHITDGKQFCSQTLSKCVTCLSHTDCSNGEVCNANGDCVECISNTQCTTTTKSRCDLSTFTCKHCNGNNADCSHILNGLVKCSTTTSNECVECNVDSECNDPTKPLCFQHKCVQCRGNTDCPLASLSRCELNQCVTCDTKASCSHIDSRADCFSGFCKECVDNNNCLTQEKSVCGVSGYCESCNSGSLNDCKQLSNNNKFCATNSTCVQCLAHSGCDYNPQLTYCNSINHCVECLQDSHCLDYKKPYCDLSTQSCQPCINDGNCQHIDPRGTCNSGGECYQCADNNFCQDKTISFCKNRYCERCEDDSHCTHIPNANNLSKCDKLTKGCVQCLISSDCDQSSRNPACKQNVCKPCTSTFDCPNGSVCDQSDGKCYDCVTDGDCINLLKGNSNTPSQTNPLLEKRFCVNHICEYSKCFFPEFRLPNQSCSNNCVAPYTSTTPGNRVQECSCLSPKRFNHDTEVCECQEGFKLDTSKENCTKIEFSPALVSSTQMMATAAIGTSAPALFMGADPTLIWGLITLMQLFYYLLFMNVDYPENFKDFLKIFQLGRLEFLPNPLSSVYSESSIEKLKLESPPKFFDNEFSGLFFQSVGGMMMLWLSSIAMYTSCKIIQKTCLKKTFLLKPAKKIINDYEWSGFLRLWISNYFELLFGALLQIRILMFTREVYILSSISGLLTFIACFSLPITSYRLIKKADPYKFNLNKYQALFDDIDISRQQVKYHTVIVLSKRIIQACGIVFFYEFPTMQNLIPWVTYFFMIIYTLLYRPHNRISLNVIESVTEIGFFLIHSLIMVLSVGFFEKNQEKNYETKNTIGVMLICIVVGIFFLQLLLIIHEQFVVLSSMIKNIIAHFKKGMKKERLSSHKKKIRLRRNEKPSKIDSTKQKIQIKSKRSGLTEQFGSHVKLDDIQITHSPKKLRVQEQNFVGRRVKRRGEPIQAKVKKG